MDCNKDEAVRAKEIAERKVTEKDYSGAKKFALKAQNLYPGLEGISQILTTIDVYVSAEKKINGEVDWYAILGTNPWVDDETVRKQYRKLALALHPDKNKAIGADGAFKLVSEAWSLLSDKARRLAYNEKLNPRAQQKNSTQSGVPFASPSANGIHTSTKNVTSHARNRNNANRTSSTSVPSSNQNPGTFWTICNRCKTQYEYLRIYLNHTLLCPNCREAFLAVEKPPPPNAFKSTNLSSRQQHQNSRHHAASSNLYKPGGSAGLNSSNSTNLQWGSFSTMAGVNSKVTSPSTATQAVKVVQQAQEKLKRECEEAQAAALKKRRTYDNRVNGYGVDMANQMSVGNGAGSGSALEFRKSSFQAENIYGFSATYNKPNRERELSLFEIRNMLVDKARTEIRKKLKDWSSVTDSKTTDREREKMKEKESRKQKSVVNSDLHDLNKRNGTNNKTRKKDNCPGYSDGDSEKEAAALSINVPDSDFHNFDLDRTESSFGDDQVWAAYDDDDGMPRYYARIHKVMSLKPFKMKISWLNSRSNSELGPIPWVDSGFSKTCGEFRTGRHEISNTLNSFSHKVKWTKGLRGVVRIFPCKGDIWALYRNWSPDWNEHTPDEVIHKYEMVEVLDDFNEEQGVSVVPLVKVAGFRTVFQKQADCEEVQRIPKEEMFRFSHQVPSRLLTGLEAHNVPVGSWELDPAATPVELLQNAMEIEDDVGDSSSKSEEGETVENGKQTNDKR
ncbi:DnaJ domain [Melia azedarach]|uniref:DnaJ domain n=1 Tax=Melia azedarach TaxID=155640 RepID=A0ACC1X388_MELAZ|nr:DnaJ domain [Melia azedarach]